MDWRRGVGIAVGGVAVTLGVPLLALGGLAWWTFGGDAPLVPGEVAPGVYQVVDDFSAVFVVNVDGGVVLVDAGVDPEAKAIRERLAAMGDPPVLGVLLTHGHGDHVAGCGQFPDAVVAAGADDQGLVHGDHAAPGVPGLLFGPADGTCRVTRPVRDGEVVSLGGQDFVAYAIVGHTPGTTAWFGRGVLFLGDAASSDTSGRVTGPKWVFSMNPSQATESLAGLHERLAGAQVNKLAFGHTAPLDGMAPLTTFGVSR